MEYTFWFLKSSLTVPFLFFMQIYFQFKVVWRSWRRWPFVGHFYLHTFPSPAEWACSCVASVCLKGKKTMYWTVYFASINRQNILKFCVLVKINKWNVKTITYCASCNSLDHMNMIATEKEHIPLLFRSHHHGNN